jgi:uncharacterized protein (UPF0276 family)
VEVGVAAAAAAVNDALAASLPALGVGLGFREPLRGDIFLRRGEIDFLEITADHYLDATRDKERELDLLREHFTLIPHALDLSLGSAGGIDKTYLRKLARLVRRLEPPWWSEHVAFTRAGGVELGHLAATEFSREAAEVFARNVAEARAEIGAPLILENITYSLSLPTGTWGEAEFISEVLERTDCGLLLDVTNLHINSVNHGYDFREFLERLPLGRVVQLHFVGGHRHGGELIDSHSERTPEEVWDIMDYVLKRAPVRGAILERDENLPPLSELLTELARAREMGRRYGRWA